MSENLIEFNNISKFFGKVIALKDVTMKLKKENGLKEKLVGIELDGDPIIKAPENFWPVHDSDNQKVGRVSRAYYSPRLKKNIALAIVDIDYSSEGTDINVATPNGDLPSKVVKLPWFNAEKENKLD